MIENIFNTIVQMGIIGGALAFVVIIIRTLTKNRLPKIVLYVMWVLVFIKFIIPIDFSLPVSILSDLDIENATKSITRGELLIPNNNNFIEQSTQPIITIENNDSNSFIDHNALNNVTVKSINVFSLIWFVGMLISLTMLMSLYFAVSRKFRYAQRIHLDFIEDILVENNSKAKIYTDKNTSSPMVLGIIHPKIILPTDFNFHEEKILKHILLHELQHVKWKDSLINILALMVLSIHWFNPIVWISYILFNRDIEGFCDERVLKQIGADNKSEYANSLLFCAIGKRKIAPAYTCSFVENNVKERIKGVMKYKKIGIITGIVAIVLIATVALIFATNGTNNHEEPDLSFLSINNTMSLMTQDDDGVIVNDDTRIMFTNELAKLFKINKWKEKKVNSPYELSADIIFSDFHVDHHKLMIYETEPLAMINYNGDYRYYKIPEDIYPNVEAYIIQKGIAIVHEGEKSDEMKDIEESTQLQEEIENNIAIIMSSPTTSSNPGDYIKEHSKEYETIIKMGDDALSYLLTEFEKGNADGLKGQIMKYLCVGILGARNNVENYGELQPMAWYNTLDLSEEQTQEVEELISLTIEYVGLIDNNSFEGIVNGDFIVLRGENIAGKIEEIGVESYDFLYINYRIDENQNKIVESMFKLEVDAGKYQGIINNQVEIKISGVPDELSAKQFIVEDQLIDQIKDIEINENIKFYYHTKETGVKYIVEIARMDNNEN